MSSVAAEENPVVGVVETLCDVEASGSAIGCKMLCHHPFRKGVLEMGCGRCKACQWNRARLWVGRMLLESKEHPANSFVTLTYNEEHCPKNKQLEKRHWQLFMKKLRDRLKPRKIRFYAVGEYGEQFTRPHFHAILFNVGISDQEAIESCWEKGFTLVGSAEVKSMSYVCGYMQKNLTNKHNPSLAGRPPEFCSMSLRPGIGHGVINRMEKAYASESGKTALQEQAPRQIRIGQQVYPLGRYLKDQLLKRICIDKSQETRYREAWKQGWTDKKLHLTVTEYETARKAHVQQQHRQPRRRRYEAV